MLDRTMLEAVTRELFIPGLQNQLYDEMPVLQRIVQNGVEDAKGRALLDDVVLFKNAAKGRFQGYSYVITQGNNLIVQATLNYANYYQSVSISLDEEKQNTGTKEVLVKMLEPKFEAARTGLKLDVNTDLYLALTAVSGKYTLVGMQAVCSTTNTYANINRATAGNEGWQSNVDTTAITDEQLKDPAQGTKYMPTVLRRLWLKAAHDKWPTLGVLTKNLYEVWETIAETHNLQFGNEEANLGFGKAGLSAKSAQGRRVRLDIIWDSYCPAKAAFLLTPEDFKAFVFAGANFEGADVMGTGQWQRGGNQLAASMQIVWMGQIICRVPREQAFASALGDG